MTDMYIDPKNIIFEIKTFEDVLAILNVKNEKNLYPKHTFYLSRSLVI